MIAALLLFAQLAVSQPVKPPVDAIVVKGATRTTTVQLVGGAEGPMLRVLGLAPALDVVVTRRGPDAYTVRIADAILVLRPGLPYVELRDTVHQLTAAPRVVKGELLVPMQLVADILPMVVRPGLMWDPARRELRMFSKAVRAPESPSRPAAASAVATTPRRTERPAPARVAARGAGATRRLVVVDAGHGGPDRGMSGPIGGGARIHEKDVTLQVSKRVGAKLETLGVDVLFTRQRDTLIALSDRGRIANDAGGDLFISIHVNAANPNWKSPGGARGFETYFLAEARTEDARRVERMENEAVQYEAAAPGKGDPLSFIVADMLQNEHLRESSELAELMQQRLGAAHPGPNRGVKQAGFAVLVRAFMPAVLVEIGFGTNAAEAAYISSEAGQEQIANAIAAATLEYLARYDRRVGGGAGG